MPLSVAFVALSALKRIDAGCSVDRRAIAPPRIDIGDDFRPVLAVGIKIGIEHTGFAHKLQFAASDLNHIKPRFAE